MKDNLFMKFVNWVGCAFERCSKGASARKLTMFAVVIFVAFLHFIVGKIFITGKVTETQSLIWILLGFLIIDSTVILLLAQILTAQDLKELTNTVVHKENETESTKPATTG